MRSILVIIFICFSNFLFAQEDLLSLIDSSSPIQKTYVKNAFKSSRVINGHSIEFIGKGVMDVRILHRFGSVKNGIKDLFGFDQANMRMGFDSRLAWWKARAWRAAAMLCLHRWAELPACWCRMRVP